MAEELKEGLEIELSERAKKLAGCIEDAKRSVLSQLGVLEPSNYYPLVQSFASTLYIEESKKERKEELASDKQLNYLRRLVGDDMIRFMGFIKEQFGKETLPAISMQEASTMITCFMFIKYMNTRDRVPSLAEEGK